MYDWVFIINMLFSKKAGITIFADTTIRLSHIGRYSYSFDFINRGVAEEPNTIVFKNK